MDDRNGGAGGNLCDAADIAGRDHIRLEPFDIGDLAVPQPFRQLRLENVVGARRAATQMTLRYIFDDKAKLGKQFFWFAHYLLSVLQRAGRMIGNSEARG